MVNDKMVNSKWLRHVGYGFGDMSSSMFWKIFSYYLPFFYSNIFGLSLTDAGIILLVTRIWDAVSDPMMGVLADRTQTRWASTVRTCSLWHRCSPLQESCCSPHRTGATPPNWSGRTPLTS